MKMTAIALATLFFGTLATQADACGEKSNSGRHANGFCLQIGESEKSRKVRVIIGYRDVVTYRMETRFRNETHYRNITKYRNETRFRNVTRYRLVTRYRNEWRTRTIRTHRMERTRVMVGTSNCGQPVYRIVNRQVPCHSTQRYQVRVPYQVREAYTVREAFCARVPYTVQEHYTVRVPYQVRVPVKKRIPIYGFKRVTKKEPRFMCFDW